jgi:hypothetical protein
MAPRPSWHRAHRSATGRPLRRCAALWLVAASALPSGSAVAAPAYACGGAALAGGAQLLCSHVDPRAPAQNCSYSWALRGSDDATRLVQGTFLLVPGSSNMVVFQGFGFDAQLANPVIVCVGAPS